MALALTALMTGVFAVATSEVAISAILFGKLLFDQARAEWLPWRPAFPRLIAATQMTWTALNTTTPECYPASVRATGTGMASGVCRSARAREFRASPRHPGLR